MDVRSMAAMAIVGSFVALPGCGNEIAGPEGAGRDLTASGLTATVRLTCIGKVNTGFVHNGASLDVEWSNGTRARTLFCLTTGPRTVEVVVDDVTDRWTAVIALEDAITGLNPGCHFDSETTTGPLLCTYETADETIDDRHVDNPGDLEAGAIAQIR